LRSQLHKEAHRLHGGTFGSGGFGAFAEAIARFFGTPQYLIGQTVIVIAWMVFNAYELVHFDPFPFILLNLAFSLQAAYAAPLILLAQTRQAARDKAFSEADEMHREQVTDAQTRLLEENTRLTEEVHRLTLEVHALVVQRRQLLQNPPPLEP
jgi:uncharacterized membrane protein